MFVNVKKQKNYSDMPLLKFSSMVDEFSIFTKYTKQKN